jgi:hypothetical protein
MHGQRLQFQIMIPNPTTTVATVLCHQHVPMALECLGSLLRLCTTTLRLRIHDDGSLTPEDLTCLAHQLQGVQIVNRKDADARLSDEFARYPNVLRWRSSLPLMLKAFDAVIYCADNIYAYVDSDVLFLRSFENPFQLSAGGARAIYMRDREHSYSLRSWQKAISPGIRLPGYVNTGMMVIEKDRIDFDLLEWFLARPRHHAIPTMVEQTFFAMVGESAGCREFDPVQIRVMREGESTYDLVAGHFTARTRCLLPKFVRRSRAAKRQTAPVVLKTIDPGKCSAWHLLHYEVRRGFGRAFA